jgi:hypothetical protein
MRVNPLPPAFLFLTNLGLSIPGCCWTCTIDFVLFRAVVDPVFLFVGTDSRMVLSATSAIQCAFVRWIDHCIELDLISFFLLQFVDVGCSDYLSSFFFLFFLVCWSLLLTLLGSRCWLTGLGSGKAIHRDSDSCPSLTSHIDTGIQTG